MNNKNKKNILIIDGSFIGHRSVFALSKNLNKDVSLDTQEEMILFEQQYKSDIISLGKSFDANIRLDGIVVFIDNKSWRHSVEPFKPYFIDENSSEDNQILSYKGNRKKKKEESTLDYDNLNYCMANAGRDLDKIDGFHVSQVKGFEADDGIYLTAHYLSADYNVIIFANDGDLGQSVINDSVFYFNNSKSKEKPNRCIYVDQSLKLVKAKPMELMQYKNKPSVQLMNQLSKIEIGSDSQGAIDRSFENGGIAITYPKFYGLTKSIVGDKKDNIKPIIGWFTKTGRMNRVLPKNIDIAISGMATTVEFDDALRAKHNDLFSSGDVEAISDFIVNDVINSNTASDLSELTKLFLMNLLESTKQKGIGKNIFAHLKHNINMMMLSVGSVHNLGEIYDLEIKPKIVETTKQKLVLDNSNLTNQNVDIIHSSIPDDENITKPKGDLVDDILNNL